MKNRFLTDLFDSAHTFAFSFSTKTMIAVGVTATILIAVLAVGIIMMFADDDGIDGLKFLYSFFFGAVMVTITTIYATTLFYFTLKFWMEF